MAVITCIASLVALDGDYATVTVFNAMTMLPAAALGLWPGLDRWRIAILVVPTVVIMGTAQVLAAYGVSRSQDSLAIVNLFLLSFGTWLISGVGFLIGAVLLVFFNRRKRTIER